MTGLYPVACWLAGGAAAAIAYAYVAYPGFLWLLARVRPRRDSSPPAEWPRCSVSIPAFNEESSIADTIEQVLKFEYPSDRLQVVVVSDASTDRTDQIVRQYQDRGVELLRLPRRAGKTAAENAARAVLTGDIIINTDASVRVHPAAIKALVSALADPSVGVASSRDISVARKDDHANLGEAGYVGYEMWVRDLETRLGSIVGASGSLYAIRRELHDTLVPEALSRDFAAALIAREQGYRAVSVPDAICYVPRGSSLGREYRRKVRTMTRGLETLWYKKHLMNPFKHGLFAWMLISHKLARWLVPWAALLGLIAVVVLAVGHWWARLALASALVVLGLAAIGWIIPDGRPPPRLVAIPAYLISGLVAGLVAWIRALRGELNPVWEPTRREPGA